MAVAGRERRFVTYCEPYANQASSNGWEGPPGTQHAALSPPAPMSSAPANSHTAATSRACFTAGGGQQQQGRGGQAVTCTCTHVGGHMHAHSGRGPWTDESAVRLAAAAAASASAPAHALTCQRAGSHGRAKGVRHIISTNACRQSGIRHCEPAGCHKQAKCQSLVHLTVGVLQ